MTSKTILIIVVVVIVTTDVFSSFETPSSITRHLWRTISQGERNLGELTSSAATAGAPVESLSTRLRETVFVRVGEEIDLETTTPLFFHIPKTGGTSVQDLAVFCLGLVGASEVGVTTATTVDDDERNEDDQLRLVTRGEAIFVNVDTTTLSGMARAQQLGFAESGLAEIIFTSFVPQASNALFSDSHKASIFSLFRHPVERAVSLFYYLQDADWERTYKKEWKHMTLMEYAEHHAERNWMVRMLVGKYKEELVDEDLEFAKRFVSDRMWIGLTSKMEESIRRFGAVYGWNNGRDWGSCVNKYATAQHGANKHNHPQLNPESAEWKRLLEDNEYDYQLFLHAANLFQEQESYFETSHETV